MTTAASNVSVKLTLKGQDQASAVINKVGASVDEFGKHGDAAASRAGKLSTALSSLGDFAGHSEGAFRQASEAAGAFDDVLTVIPGGVGLAVGAIAGLTTVLVLQAKAAAETRARFEQAFGEGMVDVLQSFKDKLDVSAEAIVDVAQAARASGRTMSDLQTELQRVVDNANAVGDDGSAAIKKFAASLRNAITPAQKLKNTLAGIGVGVGQVSIDATGGSSDVQTVAAQEQKKFRDQMVAVAGDLEKTEKRIAEIRKDGGRYVSEMADMQLQLKVLSEVRSQIIERVHTTQGKINALVNGEARARRMMERDEDKRIAKKEKAERDALRKKRVVVRKKDDPSFGGFIEGDDSAEKHMQAREKAQKFEQWLAEAPLRKMAAEMKFDAFMDEMHAKDVARQRAKIMLRMDVASSVTGSIATVMKAFGAEEAAMRVQAGVESAIAFGRGLVALGAEKYPQAISFFAGSAALAVQAIAPPSMSAGGGSLPGGAAAGPQAVGAGPSGAQGQSVVINFGNGVVLGSPHEVARTIKGALATAQGTGF